MVEITKDNEPIYVQLRSHSEQLAAKDSTPVVLSSGVICEQQQANRCFTEISKLSSANRTKLEPLLVKKSEAILFSGKLINASSPIKSMKQRRHAVACRYMLSESEVWSKNWPCTNFDEKQRIKYSIR